MRSNAGLEAVLSRLDGVSKSGTGYEARCPAHDDRHASLSITAGDDGRVLLHCHAGCQPENICERLGMGLRDLFPSGGTARGNGSGRLGRIIATYEYQDEAGNLLYQVCRFDPKNFRQRRPDGNGGWTWKLGDTPRVLYRLPQLLAANRDGWVFVAEGEKDADSLVSVGLTATCNPGGAGKWGRLSDDSALHGRRVAIIPDNDTIGVAHAKHVAQRLYDKAAEVRIVELPGESRDVSDWLAGGGTVDRLHELVDAAPRFEPPESIANTSPKLTTDLPMILLFVDEHRVVD